MEKSRSLHQDKPASEIAVLQARLLKTEKRLTEAHEEIERYRNLLEATADWIYWITPTGSINYVSPASKSITGYEPQEFLDQSDLLLKIVHPDDRARVAERIKDELSKPIPCSDQFRIITKSGETHWIWHQCRPVYDKNQRIIGRSASNRDITELLEAQHTSDKNRQLLRLFFDSLPDPVHMINRNFEIVLTNKKLLDLKGVREEDIKNRHCYEIFQSRNTKCEHCAADQAFSTGQTAKLLKTLPLPDGTIKYFEVYAHPVKDENGSITHVIEITRDISEQKQIEAELEQSRDTYVQLASAIPLGIISCDINGKITFLNEHIFKILGLPAKENLLFSDIFKIHGFEAVGLPEKIKQVLQTGKHFLFQSDYTNAQGEKSILRFYIDPIRNPDKTIKGALCLVEDFTAYIHLQKELARSEHKFHEIFNFSPEGMILIDKALRILDVNQKIEKITGFSRDELIGQYIWDMAAQWTPQSDRPEKDALYYKNLFLQQRTKLINGSQPISFKSILQDKDGRIHHLEEALLYIPINDDSFLINTKTDITDKYLAQQALKDSEKRYKEMYRLFRLIADNDPDMLWAKDLQGRFIFTNKAICETLLGAKDVYEPIGKDDLFFAKRLRKQHPENPEWHNFGEACLDSDKITLEAKKPMQFEEYGNVMGKFLFLDVHKAPLRDEQGNIIGTVGSARDITQQKMMEKEKEAIRDELKRLAAVIEQADVAVIITDTDGTMQYVNRAFEVDTGYAKEEAIGKNPRILKSEEHSPEFFKEMWETITSGKTWHNTIINRKKDGTIYYEDAIIFPLFDSQGKIANYAGLLRDISKEIELEKQVRHMQKMESIGILTGGIAHDFNNLLTVINGYTDLGLHKYGNDKKIRAILTAIQAAGNRAAELTSQLLAFSRKQIISPQILDINETILHLEKMLKRIIEEHIYLEFFLAKDLPKIKADPVQIEQILMNLVVNARDALNELPPQIFKEKYIQIETRFANLDAQYTAKHKGVKEGEYVCISVSDNGIGMDRETLDKIFDPFFTTKEVGKGSGLGLSTVYGIVKQNGGNIYAYSEPGKGTTIKIYWPVCNEEPTTKEETEETNLAQLQGDETILLVEDDPYVREVGYDSLTEFGYQVFVAASGAEALKLIEDKNIKPKLLITDLVMPSMSGKELAMRIKTILPKIKIIFASGYTENLIVKNGILEEGIHFVQKPYQIAHFIRLVRQVLDERS